MAEEDGSADDIRQRLMLLQQNVVIERQRMERHVGEERFDRGVYFRSVGFLEQAQQH